MGKPARKKKAVARFRKTEKQTIEEKIAWVEKMIISLLAERSDYTVGEIMEPLNEGRDLSLEADLGLNANARGKLRKRIQMIALEFNPEAEVTLKECEGLKTVRSTQQFAKLKAGLPAK